MKKYNEQKIIGNVVDYNEFLLERLWNGSKKLTDSQFFKLFKENCSQYDPKIKIYKTVNFDVDYFYIYNTEERKSMEGSNYYTLLMNNLESWKEYPKRQQICSYNYPWDDSRSDHDYRVIPFDNSKWGVAPKDDIWQCNTALSNAAEILFGNMRHLFHTTDERYWDIKITDKSWEEFIWEIEEANEENFDDYASKWARILKIKKSKIKNLLGYIEDNFRPIIANFKVSDYKDLRKNIKFVNPMIDEAKEIWTDSPCLYIRSALYKEIEDKLINMK